MVEAVEQIIDVLHLVVAPDVTVAYHPVTGRVFSPPGDKDRRGGGLGSDSPSDVPPHARREFAATRLVPPPEATSQLQPPPAPAAPGSLDRLSLHVSHDCNMRCRYCYAAAGSYGGPSQCMTPDVAGAIVRRIARSATSIGLIQFFGGEPLLAVPSMRAACLAAHRAHGDGLLQELPAFRTATNLTRMSKDVVDLVRSFDIEVIGSCDGPEAIHDQLRPFADGAGSFATVAHNIETLQKATGGRQPKGLAATYSRLHQELGITPADLSSFLCSRFGIAEAIITPMRVLSPAHESLAARWSDPLRDHAEHARSALRSIADSQAHIDLSGLLMAPYVLFPSRAACDNLCPAGLRTVSVTPTGDVYPCQLFIGSDEFHMGNALRDDDIQRSARYRRVWHRLRDNVKSAIPSCQDCWLRLICRSCPGLMLRLNGAINRPVEDDCLLKQGLTEGTLLEVTRIRQDPVRWTRFVAGVRETIQAMRGNPRGGLS